MKTHQQQSDRGELIEHYARGGEKLSLAIRGLTREDLLQAPPADKPELGRWTIQQVVCHLMDSELVIVDRIKRVIADEDPQLLAYDENRWAEHLTYHEQSAEDAVAIVDLARKQLARVLAKLPESAWSRAGMHSERGKLTLRQLVEIEINHLDHHLKFIHAKRAAMGKEMW